LRNRVSSRLWPGPLARATLAELSDLSRFELRTKGPEWISNASLN
jgi:hypothetical protein